MLEGKTIVLGITGSIAAYKMANVASMLVKMNAGVYVIMTRNACNFINPITFETLTGHKCIVDTFDRDFEFNVKHVSLARRADVLLIAPCTANMIGKIASGICDDMLSTTVMATKAPCLIAPAMNTGMWTNPILQDNILKLKKYGYQIIPPVSGRLACGDIGSGKMESEDVLVENILLKIARQKDMEGRRVLISAGPTREAIDPVRFVTNHSSGKMGYALAKCAAMRGACVTLVSGPVNLKPFVGVRCIPVTDAAGMAEQIVAEAKDNDMIIMCAAVADFTPEEYSAQKIKKSESGISVPMRRTMDILKRLGAQKRKGQLLVGFSMETENLLENSRKKLLDKNLDAICANTVAGNSCEGQTGFGCDTNRVTVITRNDVTELPLCSKEETADRILNKILSL